MKKFLNAVATFFRTVNKASLEPRCEYVNYKDNDMARITELNNKYALTLDGAVVATYARARDARRGASRRGLTVA